MRQGQPDQQQGERKNQVRILPRQSHPAQTDQERHAIREEDNEDNATPEEEEAEAIPQMNGAEATLDEEEGDDQKGSKQGEQCARKGCKNQITQISPTPFCSKRCEGTQKRKIDITMEEGVGRDTKNTTIGPTTNTEGPLDNFSWPQTPG